MLAGEQHASPAAPRLPHVSVASSGPVGALWLAAMAVVIPLIVVEPLADQLVLPRLAATSAFVGVGLLFAGYLAVCRRDSSRCLAGSIVLPLAALVVANLLAAALAVDRRASLLGENERFQGVLPSLVYVALFLLSAVFVRTRRDLSMVMGGLFVSGTTVAVYAIIQKVGLDWVNWVEIPSGRVGSTFAQPDALAGFLVVSLAATVGLLASSATDWRWLLAAGTAVMAVSLLLTESRAGWIGGAVVAMILAATLLRGLQWTRFVVICVLLCLIVGGAFFVKVPQGRSIASHGAERIASTTDLSEISVAIRLGLWRTALEMIRDRPALGAGQDAFAILFPEYRQPNQPGITTDNVRPESAHNVFFDIATGTGLIGLGSFVWLIVSVLSTSWRSASLCNDTRLRRVLLASTTAIIGYLCALYFGFAEAMTTWALWLLMGAAVGVAGGVSPSNVARATRWHRTYGWTIGATALIGGTAALAWAGTLVAGDLAAGQAQRAARVGDLESAVRFSRRASTLNPLERQYLLDRGQYELDLATSTESIDGLEIAAATYARANSDFAPDSYSLLMLATARGELASAQAQPMEDVYALLEQAATLDPYNLPLRVEIANTYAWLGNDAMGNFHLAVADSLQHGH